MLSIRKEYGQLIIIDIVKGYEQRNESMKKLIILSDKKYNIPDFTEVCVDTDDAENTRSHYSMSSYTGKNCFPDFNFDKWEEVGIKDFTTTVNNIRNLGINSTVFKVGWRGNSNTNRIRKHLVQIGSQFSHIMDIIDTGNWIPNSNSIRLDTTTSSYETLEETIGKYAVLLDIEGNGYSGRLKYLLHSGKPVIIVDRPHKEYFFQYLKPFVHYIPVNRNLSNLVEMVVWCLKNYKEALQIGNNAKELANKYITRDYALEVIKNILYKHIKVNDFVREAKLAITITNNELKNTINLLTKKDCELVLARYNEDISWSDEYKHLRTVYNKGLKLNIENCVNLDNVGRESHTFLIHIINNYDNLANITIFFQGMINDRKEQRILPFHLYLLNSSDKMFAKLNILEEGYDWNYDIYTNNTLEKSDYTLGTFTEKVLQIPFIPRHRIVLGAYMSVGKELIRSRSKQYYENILKLTKLSKVQNPEDGHFMERSWCQIFNNH